MRGVLNKDLVQLDMESRYSGYTQSTANSKYNGPLLGRRFLIWPIEYKEDIDFWVSNCGLRFEMAMLLLGME